MQSVALVTANEDFATGTWHDIAIHVQRGTPTVEAVDALWRASVDIVGRGAHRVTYLLVIESRSAPPTTEARSALVGLFTLRRQHIAGYFVVAEGGGLRAATVRSVGIALSLVAPKAFPFVVVSSVEEVAEKLSLAGRPNARTDVPLAIARLRACLPARHASTKA